MLPIFAKRPYVHLQAIFMGTVLSVLYALGKADVPDAEPARIHGLPFPLDNANHGQECWMRTMGRQGKVLAGRCIST